MPAQRDIAQRGVGHAVRAVDGVVDGVALGFVHRGAIAPIDVLVLILGEFDPPAAFVEDDAELSVFGLFDRGEAAVVHSQLFVVLQKIDAVACSERPFAALGRKLRVLAGDHARPACQLACLFVNEVGFGLGFSHRKRRQLLPAHLALHVLDRLAGRGFQHVGAGFVNDEPAFALQVVDHRLAAPCFRVEHHPPLGLGVLAPDLVKHGIFLAGTLQRIALGAHGAAGIDRL